MIKYNDEEHFNEPHGITCTAQAVKARWAGQVYAEKCAAIVNEGPQDRGLAKLLAKAHWGYYRGCLMELSARGDAQRAAVNSALGKHFSPVKTDNTNWFVPGRSWKGWKVLADAGITVGPEWAWDWIEGVAPLDMERLMAMRAVLKEHNLLVHNPLE